ncbi:MAG TPA: type II secretion system minor pseudopilin GspH [Gammaproteobacteria bacterium]
MKTATLFLPGRSRGFTLFEILVVVFVIGVIVTFGSLSISQHSDRYVEDEARRIHHLIRLATEEAVLSAQELSFLITNKGYSFAQLEGPKWEPIVDDRFFRQREFPENLKVKMKVYDEDVSLTNPEKPVQIYLLSSGEVTPFTLVLSGESSVEYTITGNLTGQITYQQPEAKDAFGG